jgi:hypothetical protein
MLEYDDDEYKIIVLMDDSNCFEMLVWVNVLQLGNIHMKIKCIYSSKTFFSMIQNMEWTSLFQSIKSKT